MLGATVLMVLAAAGTASAGEPVRRALVVAYNGSENPQRPPLRYADDDGLLWAEALSRLGFETRLLTLPDADTARRRSPFLGRAQPPTSAALSAAVSLIAKANRADRAAGRSTDVMVVYVGHGDVGEDGRAYLTLLDRELDQTALYAEVIDSLEADFIHLLVDACHASGVVGSRGDEDPKVLRQLQGLLDREQFARRPNVGVAFAESDTGQTHEWSQWRAGVFSHLVRSALLGGADINGDGQIEYSELQAFVAAAMAGLENLPSKLSVHTLPPAQDPRRPLTSQTRSGPVLELPPTHPALRLSIEDEVGTRMLDVHRAAGEHLRLALPPRESYWIRTPDGEAHITQEALERGLPALKPLELSVRGPVAENYRHGLFRVPFGRAFYEGFATSSGIVPVEFPSPAAEAPLVPVQASREVAPREAHRWELGTTVSRPSLGANGLAVGVTGAWRSSSFPWRYGAQVSYGVAPGVWLNGGTLHRVSVLATVGLESAESVSATAEVGAGWAMLGITAPWGDQADLAVLAGRAAAGIRFDFQGITWRAQAHVLADWARRDGVRHWNLAPGVTLAVAVGK
ncbi:hypothetical protein DAT35_30590 [Vitiosangium sp. GDMCC 1.1324]|nr:hypothetical protein DAT35_30590 [Vitiosangium sp. GDMCC 1.1324]